MINPSVLYKHSRVTVFFLLILGLNQSINIYSQNTEIEDIIEELSSRSENEETDYSMFVEDLSNYLITPLNLNEATVEELERLHFLTEFQIENLLNYIASKGEMETIYELQLVDGFAPDIIRKMLPFVTVEKLEKREKLKSRDILKYGSHGLIAETGFLLEDQKGYIFNDTLKNSGASNYLGDKSKYKIRYDFHYRDKFHVGLTAEKDAGEAFNFEKNKKGFDFYSAHIQINNYGIIKSLTIGDYQVKFGQGLIIWTGFGMGKSADVLNIRKKGQGIRYSSSSDENNFMRGVASSLKLGNFEFIAFFSKKQIDANLIIKDTLVAFDEKISAFQSSGYHRTLSEMEDRKLVDELIIGSKLGFNSDIFKISINVIGYEYGVGLEKSEKPYKLFDFVGNRNLNGSIDYHLFYKKLSLFGEAAISQNGGMAFQNGLIAAVVPQLSFSLLHRYYQRDYQAYYSNSFSENSRISNEQGLFYGLEFHPFRKLKISAYADSYQFPWLKFIVDAPSGGNEYFVQTSFLASKSVEMYFRWRNETKPSNYKIENQAFNQIVNAKKDQFRYQINYRVSQFISLRNRIEVTHYQQFNSNEIGYMFYQDFNLDLQKLPVSVYLRYAVFDAAYDARIYAYENDLLYNFSAPIYSGKGSRFYVMIKYRLLNKFDFRIRYSQFFYPGLESISSGLSEIQGNRRSDLKFQVVLRL